MSDINELERRIYKNYRNHPDSTQNSETLFGTNFMSVIEEYQAIYQDYLQNLLINLISYKNAPITFDGRYCEWSLRQFGFCRVGADDADNVYVLNSPNTNINDIGVGQFGLLNDISVPANPFNKDKHLIKINRLNVHDLKNNSSKVSSDGVFITIANKYNYYYGQLGSTICDFNLVDRVSKTLAYIKATEIFNLQQMHVPFIGFTKNKNLTAMNVWSKINSGIPFVALDEEVGDLDSVVKIADLNIPNFLNDLKEQWNNEMSEMLTMLGINNVGVDKKERLVKSEVDANSQLIEASGNVYLDARNEQLALLNEVLGTHIEAEFNQSAYRELVQLLTDTQTDAHALTKTMDDTGDKIAKGDEN